MSLDPDLRRRIEAWVAADPDPGSSSELVALVATADGTGPDASSAAGELGARFGGRLAFGTAGLRAEMGAGPMRMNRLVVRQAAAGLAGFLGPGALVVIGFDARHRSDDFALDSARVLAAAGCRVRRFETIVPTPVLAFAVRHLGADAGVMCTASHNPPRDNGYKVYLGDGAQIVPPHDVEIAASIDAVADGGSVIDLAPSDDPAIEVIGDEVVDAYVEWAIAGDRRHGGAAASPLSIVYTPLHGVGRSVAHRVLSGSGFASVHDVAAQARPDPDFSTVAFPNPEEPGALDLAIAEAHRLAADVVLANDPDADRLGVALPLEVVEPTAAILATAAGTDDHTRPWRSLTGNEIGAVLAEHILASGSGADRLVVTTFVSSRLLVRQAEHHGVRFEEVLTGFKWIVRPAIDHPELRFVFGYEEALGFSVDPYVRDKDGITAATAFARAMDDLARSGRTVGDLLGDLARRHGHHATRTWSVRFPGPHAGATMAAVVDRWRSRPPEALAGRAVVAVTDMALGGRLPPTDAVVVDLDGGARVVLRPSGTEPKLKVYLEVVEAVPDGVAGVAAARERSEAAIEVLRRSVATALDLPT